MLLLPNAQSQDLVELLQERRHKAVAENIITSGKGLAARGPELLPVQIQVSNVLNHSPEELVNLPTFNLFKIRRIPKLGRSWFQERFADSEWVFLGSNELSPVDTTFTWRLRAMLEAEYGTPTQTITDLGHWKKLTSEQFIQFEYWFVLNNEIPLLVVDTNGPFERGIVVASDARYAADLEAIRNAVFEPLLLSNNTKPYVDYYYDEEYQTWYRTGFDGVDLFVKELPASAIGNSRPVYKQN